MRRENNDAERIVEQIQKWNKWKSSSFQVEMDLFSPLKTEQEMEGLVVWGRSKSDRQK